MDAAAATGRDREAVAGVLVTDEPAGDRDLVRLSDEPARRSRPTPAQPPDPTAPPQNGPHGHRQSTLRATFADVRTEVGKAVVGQDGAVTGLIVALLAGGHVLLEGVPGVAKTLLVRSLSRTLPLETRACSSRPT